MILFKDAYWAPAGIYYFDKWGCHKITHNVKPYIKDLEGQLKLEKFIWESQEECRLMVEQADKEIKRLNRITSIVCSLCLFVAFCLIIRGFFFMP